MTSLRLINIALVIFVIVLCGVNLAIGNGLGWLVALLSNVHVLVLLVIMEQNR